MPRPSTPTQIDDEDKLSRVGNAVCRLARLIALEALSTAGQGLTEHQDAKHHEVDQDKEDRI